MRRHADPLCPRCGADEITQEGECLTCRVTPPPWTAAASVGPYGGTLRDLILTFKKGRRDELAAPLAELLHDAFRTAAWPAPDLLAAVPIRWSRRLRRGFNQAGLLAARLAPRVGAPCVRALRRRRGGTQAGRSRAARLALPARTFAQRRPVAGRVLLVDDVLTTGATAAACSAALLRAGAREVYLLTLARAPRPGRIP